MAKKKTKEKTPRININSDDFILIADFHHKVSEINSLMDEPVFHPENKAWAVTFSVASLCHTTYFLSKEEGQDQINAIKTRLHKPINTVTILTNEDLDFLKADIAQEIVSLAQFNRRVISVDIKNIMNEYVATLLCEAI